METPIARASARLNRAVELIVAALMVALVLDVWLGVIDRYHFHWQLPWPETLARYLMIWAAMLAVSSGIARREHIGLTTVIDRLPFGLRRTLLMISDVLALALFAYLLWFGLGFATGGANKQAMIFGVSMAPFYAAIPVSAAICCVQLILVILRDKGRQGEPATVEMPK